MTNYSHVLLLLLRLRQLCCHPSLVTARSGALQRKLLSGDLTEFDKLLASIFSKETPTGTGAKVRRLESLVKSMRSTSSRETLARWRRGYLPALLRLLQ